MSVFVEGTPVPQGSLRAGSRGQLYYSNASSLKPWRKRISDAVKAFGSRETSLAPIVVRVTFHLPRPKSVKRTLPTVPPDLDKLMRAVGDALTESGIYKDDGQVVEWRARKRYALPERGAGVEIDVWEDHDDA